MDLHENSLKYIHKAAEIANINNSLLNLLDSPMFVHEADLKIQMDNGEEKAFPAFRVQHNNLAGIFKGGIRFHENANKETIEGLATEMTIKTSVLGLHLGGGKGGIVVNPKELSKTELEKLSRNYIQVFKECLGPNKDVPAPDVNTNPEIMAWMQDEYLKLNPGEMGAVTGKPLEFGGSAGRGRATAQGGVYLLQDVLKAKDINPQGLNMVIQGFGNAGSNFAILAKDIGINLIAASDSRGGIYSPDGIKHCEIVELKKEGKKAQEGTETFINPHNPANRGDLNNQEILGLECDILVLSALDNVINKSNVKKIKAKYIVELANGPISYDANLVLEEKGIEILPDIFANTGGVAVSGMELTQNITNHYWSEEYVLSELKRLISDNYKIIAELMKEYNCSMRFAAIIKSLKRLEKLAVIRGYF